MKSMTGFGRGTFGSEIGTASVEATSVNRKQLEIVSNLPKPLQGLENQVRQAVLPYLSRGRLQLNLQWESQESVGGETIRINAALAKTLEGACRQISQAVGHTVLLQAADFIKYPGLLLSDSIRELNLEEAWMSIAPALDEAMKKLDIMRVAEGKHLKEEFLQRLSSLENFTVKIASLAEPRPQKQRDLLMKRLSDLGIPLELDDERLLREVAMFADRCDISEELSRLSSHFSKFREYLGAEEAAGRSLDFLCQELFREFNTIGSKANEAEIAQTVVQAKTELEKIREQLQNIE